MSEIIPTTEPGKLLPSNKLPMLPARTQQSGSQASIIQRRILLSRVSAEFWADRSIRLRAQQEHGGKTCKTDSGQHPTPEVWNGLDGET